jgi:deoxyribodipyrimidine photo-lyase
MRRAALRWNAGSIRPGANSNFSPSWVPELAGLPNEWIHQPWAAPAAILKAAGVSLGEHYPHPLVDHDVARRKALRALAAIKAK